jgi:hypothetical protein
MNLFKKLFGKSEKKTFNIKEENLEQIEKKDIPKNDQDLFLEMLNEMSGSAEINSNTPELFKNELYDSLKRYYSSPEYRIELNLKDDKGNSYEEHDAFDSTYDEWKEVKSVWDRRAILFELWDGTELKKLQKWQVIERLLKDRYALKALDFLKTNINQDDFQDIRLIVAVSKLFRSLDSIPRALHHSKGAYELRPDLDIVKIEYANVLHLSDSLDDKELSHKLINEVIENKIKNETNEKEIPLLNYFVFSVGYIDSSIFAINFLKLGNCDEATWQQLAEEYYWCPIFRLEHSVFLSKNGESLRALAKLDSLANEFPWYKAGVLANIDAINQLRIQKNDTSFMNEEMEKMEQDDLANPKIGLKLVTNPLVPERSTNCKTTP